FAAAQAARREEMRTTDPLPVPLVAQPSPIVPYSDLDAALADLQSRKLSSIYVIDADYLATGNVTTYTRDAGIFGQPAANQRANQVADAIRASLMRKGLTGDELARAYAPAVRVKRFSVNSRGQLEDGGDAFALGRFAGTFGVFMLFTKSIFFSDGSLQQATVEDRQTSVFEVLLSSASSDQLLMGKVIGLGGAGLLQVLIYIVLLIVPGTTILALFQLPVARMALLIVY